MDNAHQAVSLNDLERKIMRVMDKPIGEVTSQRDLMRQFRDHRLTDTIWNLMEKKIIEVPDARNPRHYELTRQGRSNLRLLGDPAGKKPAAKPVEPDFDDDDDFEDPAPARTAPARDDSDDEDAKPASAANPRGTKPPTAANPRGTKPPTARRGAAKDIHKAVEKSKGDADGAGDEGD